MDFNNRHISFRIPDEWHVARYDRDCLAWNFFRQTGDLLEGLGIRIISDIRLPYAKRYLASENSEEFISPPNYVNVGQKPILIREIDKRQFFRGGDGHGRLYAILIEFSELAVRVRIHLRDGSDIMHNILWLDSLRIKEKAVKRQLKEIRRQSDFVIDDFVLFYREMLDLNEEEALIRLEMSPFNLRDDAESIGSVFYHELPVYWVFYDLLRQRLRAAGKSQVEFDHGQKLQAIFYDYHSGEIEENTPEEWREIKERFEKQFTKFLNE